MQTIINLRPDQTAGELRDQANPAHDAVVTHLCEELNATETHYPGTNLRLRYVPLRSSGHQVINFPSRSGCLSLRDVRNSRTLGLMGFNPPAG